MLSPRENAGCAVHRGHLYVAGGRDELHLELSTAERLNPEAMRWTPVKCMRSKRDNVSNGRRPDSRCVYRKELQPTSKDMIGFSLIALELGNAECDPAESRLRYHITVLPMRYKCLSWLRCPSPSSTGPCWLWEAPTASPAWKQRRFTTMKPTRGGKTGKCCDGSYFPPDFPTIRLDTVEIMCKAATFLWPLPFYIIQEKLKDVIFVLKHTGNKWECFIAAQYWHGHGLKVCSFWFSFKRLSEIYINMCDQSTASSQSHGQNSDWGKQTLPYHPTLLLILIKIPN